MNAYRRRTVEQLARHLYRSFLVETSRDRILTNENISAPSRQDDRHSSSISITQIKHTCIRTYVCVCIYAHA